MRSFTNWMAVAAAAVAFPSMSSAQDAPRNGFFTRLDKDGDGKVTAAEITASAQAQLDAYDKDKDGQLTADELKNGRAEERFSQIDANHDASVSLDEFKAQPRGGRGGMGGGFGGGRGGDISRQDTNGDGKLSLDELAAPMLAMIAAADADKDGSVTEEELAAARPQGGRGGPGGGRPGRDGQGGGAPPEGGARPPEGGQGGAEGGRGGRGGRQMDPAMIEEAFKRLDKDSSGGVSLDEFKAAQDQQGQGGRGGRGGRGSQSPWI